jgi:hypothetical protein
MNNRHSIMSLLVVALLVGAGCTKQVSFSQNVRPILNAKCLSCHDGSGEGSTQSGFNVKTYDNLIAGTKLGKVIVPGDAVSSTLFRLISHQASPEIHMPPHGGQSLAKGKGEPLTDAEIDTIKLWINQGAKNN